MAPFNCEKSIEREIRKIGKPESANGYMKWSDEDIDKLYSDSSERLSFEYKGGYWDEFSSALSDVPVSEAPIKEIVSDKEIDALYAASAAGLAFDYKPNYWDEFSSTLDPVKPALTDAEIDAMYASSAAGLAFGYKPNYWSEFSSALNPVKPALTDAEIDAMYASSAAGLSIDYSQKYWSDFNASFPGINNIEADAVLEDQEIDHLYQESAADLAFAYKPSYWEEMTARLRRRRRPDFLWFASAYTFAGALAVMLFTHTSTVETGNDYLADSSTRKAHTGQASNKTNTNSNQSNPELKNSTNTGTVDNGVVIIENGGGGSYPTNENVSNSNPNPNRTTNLGNTAQTGITQNVVNQSQLVDPVSPAVVPVATPNVTPTVIPVVTPAVVLTQVPDIKPVVTRTAEISRRPENAIATTPKKNTELTPVPVTLPSELTPEEDLVLTLPLRNPHSFEFNRTPSPFTAPKVSFVKWYGQGVVGASQSLVTPSDKISSSFGLGVGLEVNSGNFTFDLGVNGLIERHNDLELTREAKIYGFGSNVYKFNIDYKEMYTLETSLSVGYNLGRHRFNVGVRPSFILGTRVSMEEISQSITSGALNSGEAGDYNETRDVYGFMDGLHRFGLKPSLGYAFKVTPSMSFGANVGVEIRPSINEDYINGVNNRLPIDGQVYFRKTFSFRK